MYLLEHSLGHPKPFIRTNSVVSGVFPVITIAHYSVGKPPVERYPAVALEGVEDRTVIEFQGTTGS